MFRRGSPLARRCSRACRFPSSLPGSSPGIPGLRRSRFPKSRTHRPTDSQWLRCKAWPPACGKMARRLVRRCTQRRRVRYEADCNVRRTRRIRADCRRNRKRRGNRGRPDCKCRCTQPGKVRRRRRRPGRSPSFGCKLALPRCCRCSRTPAASRSRRRTSDRPDSRIAEKRRNLRLWSTRGSRYCLPPYPPGTRGSRRRS